MIITKVFKWSMSHRLENHNRLCKNVHGHNYKLIVSIKKVDRNQKIIDKAKKTNEGMVCDFTDLKVIVSKVIVEPFDHAFVFNENDSKSRVIAQFLAKKIGQKTLALPFRMTAENMVQWIVEEINNYFLTTKINLKCVKAELYETDDSSAIYECE